MIAKVVFVLEVTAEDVAKAEGRDRTQEEGPFRTQAPYASWVRNGPACQAMQRLGFTETSYMHGWLFGTTPYGTKRSFGVPFDQPEQAGAIALSESCFFQQGVKGERIEPIEGGPLTAERPSIPEVTF
ncbi:MAG: hypothetical protein WCW27_03150 [Patescibacteria group bacterium]